MVPEIAFFLLLAVIKVISATKSPIKLVIDNDAGSDDAMAIFLALLYEKYYDGPQVIALLTTNGNTKEENVYINNQRIIKIANRQDVEIHRGSKGSLLKTPDAGNYYGKDGLGDINVADKNYSLNQPPETKGSHAVLRLLGLSIKHKGNLRVVANGPLTNIALAIKLDPSFLERLEHLYIGAGHIDSLRDPHPEFNALMDVEAYHIVAQHATPDKVTFLPLSQVEKYLNISRVCDTSRLDEWRNDVLGALSTDIIRAQNSFEKITLRKQDRWQPLDPANMAVALNSDLVKEFKYANCDIIVCGERSGMNTYSFTDQKAANARIAYSLRKEAYKQFLIGIFLTDFKLSAVNH